MKRTIAILLAVLLSFTMAIPALAATEGGSFGAYKHVFIIGVDGAGRFFNETDTPNFDRIFADGAVTYKARAEIITTSAQNWGSILTGVSYKTHGLTNGITGENERASDTAYPSIFTYARQAMPDAELASFVNWNNINYGIIENDIGVNKQDIQDDEKLTDAIVDYFDGGASPSLFFVQFDSVDHVGHGDGSKAESYFAQIRTIDGYIGRVYDAIERAGLMKDGLFIVTADHGHTIDGGHGGLTMRETNVMLALKGRTVRVGTPDKASRNRDVAAITLYALGIERPAHMSAMVPGGVFADHPGEKRSFKADPLDAFLSALSWILTLITAPF